MKGNKMTDRNERGSRDRGGRDESSSRDRGGRDREESRGGRDRGDSDRGSRGGRGGGASSSYSYREREPDSVRKRSTQGANDFDKILNDGVKMWKPNDGDNRIRILPPTWDDAKHFGLDIYVHYGVGPDRGTYLCLQKMKGEADPIAEERAIIARDGDEKDKDYLKELEAKHRVLIYLIDRDNEKEGVQAWAMPSGLDKDIVKVSIDKTNGEVLPIDHPEDGYDVTFEKNGAGMKTKYEGASIARRSSPLGKAAWLDYAVENPLPSVLNYYDYDHIAKAFNGAGAHKEKSRDAGEHSDRDRGAKTHREEQDDGRNDRDGRTSGRSGTRDRGEDTDGRSSSRGSSRSRETSRDTRADEAPTWDSIHEMTGDELEDLVDQEKLDIDPQDAKSDEDLADWICEEMKISKPAPSRSSRRSVSDDEDSTDRLRSMRRGRD